MSTILYIGEDKQSSTSFHRAKALERLGHKVIFFNPYSILRESKYSRYLSPIHFRTGYRFVQKKVRSRLSSFLTHTPGIDIIWVNSGELLGPSVLNLLKSTGKPVVLYVNDDPTGGRDGNRFLSLIRSIPLYDLCVVVRDQNVEEFRAAGAKHVMRVFMSYDEVKHAPLRPEELNTGLQSDVAFVGTWMNGEGRDTFMLTLIKAGIKVAIWGDRWEKSPHWNELQPYVRGKALAGADYVSAIQCAKICIGLLSKGNRDEHTQRTAEIPFIGGLFCAERTPEHTQLLKEGVEAVYWNDAAECAAACAALLKDDKRREEIRMAGSRKIRISGMGNENVTQRILEELSSLGLLSAK
ncbi:MAG: hypothetical protein DI535_21180 [Citrobacter freundii]|nr:MAG: hypothetical protein DI535_21180 [Citrobacter freundii]